MKKLHGILQSVICVLYILTIKKQHFPNCIYENISVMEEDGVVLYGYETWSLTLKEECRLRVFENRALRRIFGPKRDEVTGNGKNT
jgi:hypothetical protein